MSSLPIIDDLSGFAPKAILIGEGQPADRVWTREEYLLLCHHMRNDNPPNEFLHVYCDSRGAPRFVKAKSPDVEKELHGRGTQSRGELDTRSQSDFILGIAKAKVDGEQLISTLTTAALTAQRHSRSRHFRSFGNIRSFYRFSPPRAAKVGICLYLVMAFIRLKTGCGF